MITGPLRDRFGLVARLDYYDAAELEAIVVRAAGILGVDVDDDGAWEIARRVAGHAAHRQPPAAPGARLRRGARRRHDRRRHRPRRARACSASTTAGSTRSTGRSSARCASSSAAARSGCRRWRSRVGEQPETVEDVYEPFLIQQGLLARTPRGRVAMPAAYEHLGLHRRRAPRPSPSRPPASVRLTSRRDRARPRLGHRRGRGRCSARKAIVFAHAALAAASS